MNNPISDLTRCAELALRNEERLEEWKRRWKAATGREPVTLIRRDTPVAHQRTARPCHNRDSNVTTVKMPRRQRQYMHCNLPTGPEPA